MAPSPGTTDTMAASGSAVSGNDAPAARAAASKAFTSRVVNTVRPPVKRRLRRASAVAPSRWCLGEHPEGLGPGTQELHSGEPAVFGHVAQHLIAARPHALGMSP